MSACARRPRAPFPSPRRIDPPRTMWCPASATRRIVHQAMQWDRAVVEAPFDKLQRRALADPLPLGRLHHAPSARDRTRETLKTDGSCFIKSRVTQPSKLSQPTACVSGSRGGIHVFVERVGLLVKVRVERLARFTPRKLELSKLPSSHEEKPP